MFEHQRRLPFLGRPTPLAAALLLTVAAAAWLGYAAQDAADDHRAAVETTLRDYTGMAARELARLSEESTHWLLDAVFEEARRGRRSTPTRAGSFQPEISDALARHDCACPGLRETFAEFRLDESEGHMEVVPETLGPEVGRWLSERLAERGERGRGLLPVVGQGPFPEQVAVAYTERGRRSAGEVEGFVVSAAGIGELVGHWYRNNPLLPPSTRRTAPDDSLLHVRVSTPDGSTLFVSGSWTGGPTTSYDTVDADWGSLGVEVDVRPAGADALVAGGLPPSRTPLFLGMLALVLLLGGGGLVQIRREGELARLRDDFVSGVSHELRTPLAQIRMFAELQEAGKLRTEEERRRAIAVIDREARRLTHLVENVLQINAPDRESVVRRRVSVDEAVDDAIESLRPMLDAKGASIRRETQPGLTVTTTTGSVGRILVNLLDNALKYGPPGQTITVATEEADGAVELSVDDEGPGVPVRDRHRIWDPYLRLDRDARGSEPGTGVGLAVVARLARANGGEAWVEDAAQGGARFAVRLPSAVDRAATGDSA